jgi:hypothetical protein
MGKRVAAACVAIMLLAAGCGDQGALEIKRVCGDNTAASSSNPRCAHRDGFPDSADGKGNGIFRPRGF